jgi:hypothetical protein
LTRKPVLQIETVSSTPKERRFCCATDEVDAAEPAVVIAVAGALLAVPVGPPTNANRRQRDEMRWIFVTVGCVYH